MLYLSKHSTESHSSHTLSLHDALPICPGQVCDLDFSWRSQQSVLSLVSSVFPRVFPQLPRERVVLTPAPEAVRRRQDRKSTRLNSSHVAISYAVFCLKKKN